MNTDLLRAAWRASKAKLLGLSFLLVVFGLIALTAAIYNQAFTTVAEVTLKTDRIGNQLNQHADVKIRGVIVGEVRQVHSRPDGADVTLAIKPKDTRLIPKDVLARILPKTLFGEKFVDLVVPDGVNAAALAPAAQIRGGDVIAQDRSATAIELGTVFDDLLPILQAVKPAELNSALNSVAVALQGRGQTLGNTLTTLDAYLKKFNPAVPQLERDISDLADVADTYSAAAPDLLKVLANTSGTANTLVATKDDLAKTLVGTSGFAATFNRILTTNENNLVRVASVSQPILQTLRDNGQQIPYLIDSLTKLAPRIDAALGGTGPYLHITATFVPDRGGFVPTTDCPVYGTGATQAKGPSCAGGGTGGIGSASSVAAANGKAATTSKAKGTSYGDNIVDPRGTTQEAQFIAGMVGPASGQDPQDIQGISDILFGPLLRGTEVTLS